ncbi:putative peptidase S08 family protein [Kitasatospora cheerisanensis KCTC 2395]|uniref:Putative peptidase S08 family protein n=1 Tax=Kitasatospora cheerisanensis KCTC 2395 TaxID=1348663 RepID=A0A066Z4W9_9ACTN|nr:putative peptidase S08 family protein [Kitasatospora cheerisanensis KCTC 2395]
MWGVSAGPAMADEIRDGQWTLKKYSAAEKVWPVSEGDGVIVAIIDTGVDANHPDLTGQVLPGTDFTGGADGRSDSIGHGTGMASLIAGHGHGDGAGIMGLAPKAKILPVKVNLGSATAPKPLDGVEVGKAIRYAVDQGAKVINMSFGAGNPHDEGYQAAVEYAVQKDVVLVAASGNDPDLPLDYPAKFPGVVVVSGVTESGDLWPKSATGSEVTLAGPAEDIYHANQKKGYSTGGGTSDATSYVSAIAALVRAKYPNLSAGQVINRMIKSAVKPAGKGSFPNPQYGYGIASPSAALAANPEVDNGPKENPLLHRAGSSSTPPSAGASNPAKPPAAGGDAATPQASGDSKSSSAVLIAVGGGVVALIVVVVIVLLVRRSKNGNGGGPGGPAGPGGPGGGPGYGYPPQAPGGYGQPQGQPGYPQPPYPQQQAPYPPQQPPAGGNPYQR